MKRRKLFNMKCRKTSIQFWHITDPVSQIWEATLTPISTKSLTQMLIITIGAISRNWKSCWSCAQTSIKYRMPRLGEMVHTLDGIADIVFVGLYFASPRAFTLIPIIYLGFHLNLCSVVCSIVFLFSTLFLFLSFLCIYRLLFLRSCNVDSFRNPLWF